MTALFQDYSADKGEKLFEAKSGRTGMGPPITYEAGGKQYVAFMGGLGRAASVLGPNNDAVEFPPMLFVFELDGTREFPKPAPTPRAAAPEQANKRGLAFPGRYFAASNRETPAATANPPYTAHRIWPVGKLREQSR